MLGVGFPIADTCETYGMASCPEGSIVGEGGNIINDAVCAPTYCECILENEFSNPCSCNTWDPHDVPRGDDDTWTGGGFPYMTCWDGSCARDISECPQYCLTIPGGAPLDYCISLSE